MQGNICKAPSKLLRNWNWRNLEHKKRPFQTYPNLQSPHFCRKEPADRGDAEGVMTVFTYGLFLSTLLHLISANRMCLEVQEMPDENSFSSGLGALCDVGRFRGKGRAADLGKL